MKILVTGCGGDVGLGVGRILKDLGLSRPLIGLDVHDDHPAFHFFDKIELLPRADSPEYLEALKVKCHEHQPDFVIPGSEVEIRYFYKNRIRNVAGIPLVLANDDALEVGLDKLITAQRLRVWDCPSPWAVDLNQEGSMESLSYPCIVKSRQGSGSRALWKANDAKDVEGLLERHRDLMAQEYLAPEDQEYTCGLFRSKDGETRTIIFQRKLEGGRTGTGRVDDSPEIRSVLLKIADNLSLRGSINIQLRLTSKGPVVFEINPRFSSTVYFRHLLGFQDVLWTLQDLSGERLSLWVPPPVNTRFYRGPQEIIRWPENHNVQ